MPVLNIADPEPDRGDVGIYQCTEKPENYAYCAEQVKGTAHVPAQVHHSEQIQESLQHSCPAIFGDPELTGMVLNGDLTNPVSLKVCENGDIAVKFAVDSNVIYDFTSIGFETTVEVVD